MWCKVNNDKCIQSCRFFDPLCNKRFIKNYSYFPFKSVYVLPQLISLMRSHNREWELDNLIRGVMYAISSSFGTDSRKLKSLYTLNHNEPIGALIDKNRLHIVKSFFGSMAMSDIENEIRTSLGLNENVQDSFENLHATILKIYNFIEGNKTAFVSKDETKAEIIDDFLTEYLGRLIYDNDYTATDFSVGTAEDYTAYLLKIGDRILFIDNMLMKFPNDLKNLDNMVGNILKMIRQARKDLGRAGKSPVVDARETLLTSESVLHKRIAADDALYEFYRENNKTKYVNSVLFWKFSIAIFYVSEMVLHLSEDHPIQKLNFNSI